MNPAEPAQPAAGRSAESGVPVVSVRDLTIEFPTMDGTVTAVDGLSFELPPGGALGIVGESGSGKSATSLALMGLHRGTSARISGEIDVVGVDVVSASDAAVRAMRGNDIAMVFQDPMSSLHPQFTIGDQIVEAYRTHTGAGAAQARVRAVEALDRVGIPDAARRVRAYPHEFSGGMRQRVLIAMGLVCEPKVLLADEPTTALDVTVQAQILDLLEDLRADTGMGLILVSHDLGVVAGSTERILVMQKGKAVEEGTVHQVLGSPQHPYTQALLAAVPRVEVSRAERRAANRADREAAAAAGARPAETAAPAVPAEPGPSEPTATGATASGAAAEPAGPAPGASGTTAAGPSAAPASTGATAGVGAGEPLLTVSNVRQRFRIRGGLLGRATDFYAVDDVSFEVRKGETLGIVGESGSGKTTLSRMIMRLLTPTSGSIVFEGRDITRLSDRALRPLRRDIQMIFQNPYSSLNPRMTIGDSIGAALRVQGERDSKKVKGQVQDLLHRVGLEPDHYNRFPHAFSGGQRQRIAIARSLILRPKLIICDEPVSALDVSTQDQVLRLLSQLQDDFDLTLIFVAHDLAVVRQVSDRVAVMRKGKIVEMADGDSVYESPEHPYTKQLLAAAPVLNPDEARHRRAERARLRQQSTDPAVSA